MLLSVVRKRYTNARLIPICTLSTEVNYSSITIIYSTTESVVKKQSSQRDAKFTRILEKEKNNSVMDTLRVWMKLSLSILEQLNFSENCGIYGVVTTPSSGPIKSRAEVRKTRLFSDGLFEAAA